MNASIGTAKDGAKRSTIANAAQNMGSGSFLGDLVAWDFGDGDAAFSKPRSDVREVFIQCGFDCVDDEDRDAGKALLRASSGGQGVKFGRHVVVKEFSRPNKDTPVSVGVYYQRGVKGESGDDFDLVARVRIELGRAVAHPPENAFDFGDKRAKRIATDLAAKANELAFNVTNNELSNALCKAGKQSMWARFRRKLGGAWFVYASMTEPFRKLLDSLEQLGGFYPTIQPLFIDNGGLSTKNVARASEGVLQQELDRLRADLDKQLAEGKMRPSTIVDRIAECDELLARADLYSSLLAETSNVVSDQARQIRKQFAGVLSGDDDVFDAINERKHESALAQILLEDDGDLWD